MRIDINIHGYRNSHIITDSQSRFADKYFIYIFTFILTSFAAFTSLYFRHFGPLFIKTLRLLKIIENTHTLVQ